MKLFIVSIVKDWTGLIDVTVRINGKKDYTFTLSSQFDLEEFERVLRFNPGKALNILKDRNVSKGDK
jgi:hypothetical protein